MRRSIKTGGKGHEGQNVWTLEDGCHQGGFSRVLSTKQNRHDKFFWLIEERPSRDKCVKKEKLLLNSQSSTPRGAQSGKKKMAEHAKRDSWVKRLGRGP